MSQWIFHACRQFFTLNSCVSFFRILSFLDTIFSHLDSTLSHFVVRDCHLSVIYFWSSSHPLLFGVINSFAAISLSPSRSRPKSNRPKQSRLLHSFDYSHLANECNNRMQSIFELLKRNPIEIIVKCCLWHRRD